MDNFENSCNNLTEKNTSEIKISDDNYKKHLVVFSYDFDSIVFITLSLGSESK